MSTFEIVGLIGSAVNVVISAVIGIAVQSLNGKTQKIEKLEENLKTALNELVDERLDAIREKHEAEFVGLNKIVDRIMNRLDQGDQRFIQLEKSDHQLQVSVLQELRKLQEVVATKDDLDRLRKELSR